MTDIKKKKILIVDDNERDQFLISDIFSDQGIHQPLITALSGEEAVKMISADEIGVVILDTQLPGMDGFETCQKIKRQYQNKVKVVVITGSIDAVDAVKAREMGADEYCVKTADMSEIVRVVKKMLS
ncbi:MAG: response regulator [Candidatus Omnitrophica bacterium]|nr:response regulator [Candidatus Omnitrophota bacterium]